MKTLLKRFNPFIIGLSVCLFLMGIFEPRNSPDFINQFRILWVVGYIFAGILLLWHAWKPYKNKLIWACAFLAATEFLRSLIFAIYGGYMYAIAAHALIAFLVSIVYIQNKHK
jgi:CHASE2 domain-containing sensor protein